MPFEERMVGEARHHVVLEGRSRLNVSGVEEVERFDEEEIVMETTQGRLIVRGSGLHIETLSLDGGELRVEGEVDGLTYEETAQSGGGFFSRLFH